MCTTVIVDTVYVRIHGIELHAANRKGKVLDKVPKYHMITQSMVVSPVAVELVCREHRASMAEQRARLQACRTSVRKAVTDIKSASEAWEEACSTGRTALSNVCNAHLRRLHFP